MWVAKSWRRGFWSREQRLRFQVQRGELVVGYVLYGAGVGHEDKIEVV